MEARGDRTRRLGALFERPVKILSNRDDASRLSFVPHNHSSLEDGRLQKYEASSLAMENL